MNTYKIHSSRKVYYITDIEAESEEEALRMFRFIDLYDFDEAGEIEIDDIDLIKPL